MAKKKKKDRRQKGNAGNTQDRNNGGAKHAAPASKKEERAHRKALRKERNKVKHASEQERLRMQLLENDLILDTVKPDGNCMFRSISKVLTGSEEHHANYRKQAVDYMQQNRPDFEFFVEDDEPWEDYLRRIAQPKEWGGNLELKALSDVLRVTFVIHQLDAPRFVLHCSGQARQSIHLGYSGMMHYDCVRHSADSAAAGQPATAFDLGEGLGRNNGGGAATNDKSAPITAFERIVMAETGCPNLEYIRGMMSRFKNSVDAVIEEVSVQYAMAEFNWDQVFTDAGDFQDASRHGAPDNDDDDAGINYIKTIENVKMISGCPSFELARFIFDEKGQDVAATVQELQSIFIMGGEKWPTEEDLNSDGSSDSDADQVRTFLVDAHGCKNAIFFFNIDPDVKVWRRVDIPAAPRGLARFRPKVEVVDHQDDESEIYDRVSGLQHYEVIQIVTEHGGEDDESDSDSEDDTVEIVVPMEDVGDNNDNNGHTTAVQTETEAVAQTAPARRRRPKTISRNKPCPCGSRLKYKACCHPGVKLRKQRRLERLRLKTGDLDEQKTEMSGGPESVEQRTNNAVTIQAHDNQSNQVVAI